jgi:hypothetical protein
MDKAVKVWNSLDLSNQTNLECARAWFMEGFAHGQELKELTHDEIAEIYHSEDRFSPQGNFLYYGFARAILKKAQEK